jgi:hypothetical protein
MCSGPRSRGLALAAIRSESPTCIETRRCPGTPKRRNNVVPQVIARGSTALPDGQSQPKRLVLLSGHIGDSAMRRASRTILCQSPSLDWGARSKNNRAISIFIKRLRPTSLLCQFAQCSLSSSGAARGIDGVHFPGQFPRLRAPKSRLIRGNDGNNSPLTLPSPTARCRFWQRALGECALS